jgi:hypothetical protein
MCATPCPGFAAQEHKSQPFASFLTPFAQNITQVLTGHPAGCWQFPSATNDKKMASILVFFPFLK